MLRNEWLKLRTVRGPWLLLAAGQVLIAIGASGLILSRGATDPGDGPGAVAHVGLLSLIPLVLGIMAVAGEYRYRTITETYVGSPRRGRVIAAKLGVYATVGVGYAVVGTLVALGTAAVWLAAKGSSLNLADAALWRTVAGAIVWNGLFAAIGVCIGALVRNLAAAIATALAWLALIEGLVGQLIGSSASRWLPFKAGAALGGLPDTLGQGLPQWGAGLVLFAYAAVLTLAAVRLTVRRDVA
jgi:ABC-2 type transport system permease protein